MRPYLVDEVRAPTSSVLDKTEPRAVPRRGELDRPRDLTQMMVETVDKGTADARADPRHQGGRQDRHRAEPRRTGRRTPGSCPSLRPTTPQVAVAVLVEDAGVARDEIAAAASAARSPSP